MQIPYACGLLTAANEQRHGFIKLRGAHADHEIRLMAAAGLVRATFARDEHGTFTSINRVLDAGQTFLRNSRKPSDPAPPQPMTASQDAVVAKWKARFGPPWPAPLALEIT